MPAKSTRAVLEGIRVPTLVLDTDRAEANLDRMLARANAWGVRFRPHFKTHQSADVGRLFRDRGVTACTVSSVRMGAYFAKHGWDDITIAVPVNLREMSELRSLSSLARVSVIADSRAAVASLAAGGLPGASVWLEVDCGYSRSGIRWDDADALAEMAGAIDGEDGVRLIGILTHAGRSYAASGSKAVLQVHEQSLARMARAKEAVASARPADAPLEVSVGDTPTTSIAGTMDGVTEIRPGNFIFYDLMQLDVGACGEGYLAVAVACPVIGRYPARGEVVVYGGAVHLSQASRESQRGGATYGCVVEPVERGLGVLRLDAPVVRLSQEHGVVRVPRDIMGRASVGSLLLISPVHSCLTAAAHDHYLTLDGRRFDKM